MKRKTIREETIWVMDSECCSRCGALLDYFESDWCTDCLHDAWYSDDQDRYTDFGDYDENAYFMGEYDEEG